MGADESWGMGKMKKAKGADFVTTKHTKSTKGGAGASEGPRITRKTRKGGEGIWDSGNQERGIRKPGSLGDYLGGSGRPRR